MKAWKQKLASRKLWSAIAGVVVALCAIFGVDDMTVTQVTALISALGLLAAYIFAESYVDASRKNDGETAEAQAAESGDK